MLDALAREPKKRAIYLYPTKALAQDQLRSLTDLKVPRVKPAIYDGDTEAERRWQIRKWSNLVLSNPDMLHIGVLPHHDRWGDVLSNLAYVVVDEAHVYRGVFGSHVGNVLRRLRRIARIYGADPQFLFASATIANPGALAHVAHRPRRHGRRRTTPPRAPSGRSPSGTRELLDEELGIRASALGEASRLMAALVERGLRTLCFAKSRKSAELIHQLHASTASAVSGATGSRRTAPGTRPRSAATSSSGSSAGELLGVSATDALELGIDIGLLDCVISTGFPGTVASLRQQWGRAGRRGHGLAVLVASEDALDQYFMREPETLLGRRVEAAILDHANPRVLDGHVRAAAFEAPIDDADRDVLGDEALERAALLPELQHTPAGFVWAGRDYPAARVPLRSTSPDSFAVVDTESGSLLGLVERERAYSTVHEGAVYLHLGQALPRHRARPRRARRARHAVRRRPLHAGEEGHDDRDRGAATRRAAPRAGAQLGACVRHRAGRRLPAEEGVDPGDARPRRPRPAGDDVRDGGDLVLPRAVDARGASSRCRSCSARLHAAEHALIALLPLWAMCDRWDIGGLSTNVHFQTGRPTIFVYDGHPGGVGITERGFEAFEGWAGDTATADRRLPVRARLPVVRPVAEVRQPERHARQGRRAELLRAMLRS